MPSELSARGRQLVTSPHTPKFATAHFQRVGDLWSSSNPDGYVPMCVAENKLVWDLLEPKLASCRNLQHHEIGYDEHVGALPLRRAVADLMTRTFVGRKVLPENLALLNGASSVLEILFYVLCDSGDGVLVPTPSYAGFWSDLETRDAVEIIPVHTSSETGFALTPADLEAAMQAAEIPVKALLLTNPTNPIGEVYPPAMIEELLEWADSHDIHVVLDEIYALSIFGESEFASGAQLRRELGDRLHIVWAFSKDFAVSGFRAGVLLSENEEVLAAVRALAMWAQSSTDTQSTLLQLLADEAWVDSYIAENRRRLGEAYRRVTEVLDHYGIAYYPADAGFFFLVDVRPLMDDVSWEAEERLWRRMVEELNINLTPGADCHNGEPGFMRLVFASIDTDAVVAGAHRLGRFAREIASA